MTTSNYIFEATEENFQQGVIKNSYEAPVLVDFWAEWCEPCKQLTPILEKLANDLNGQFVLAKVNSETQQALSQQFQVRSIPAVFIFRNGEVVDQFNGVLPELSIKELIDKHSTTEADIMRNKALEIIQSGDFESGKQTLLEAEKLDPENATIQIDLAHLEARDKQYDAAQKRLSQLKMADQDREQVVSLLNKIKMSLATENAPGITELRKTLEESPEESLPRFQLAMQLINQEDYEAGLEHLIYILQKDRSFQDGAAQKSLISTFSLLGDGNPLVGQYRRKMFNVLH